MIQGDRIAALMREQGLSQAELARRIGVSQPTIFKVMHGNKTGSVHLHRIAAELKTTPAYLTGETDDPTSGVPALEFNFEERECIALMRHCDAIERAAVMSLLRSIAQLRQEAVAKTVNGQ